MFDTVWPLDLIGIKMFGNQTMFDRVYSPNIFPLDRALQRPVSTCVRVCVGLRVRPLDFGKHTGLCQNIGLTHAMCLQLHLRNVYF